MEEYLTIGQAATLLHVSPTTVRRWVHQGTLQAQKIKTGKNARVLIKKDNVEGLLVPVQPPPSPQSAKSRQTAVDAILAFQHKLAGRRIDVDNLIARNQQKRERDEHCH